jgi:HEPN domain-containing protein
VRREAESLLVLAGEDLSAAGELLARYPRQAAFHLQQAAEKLLKAVLISEGLAFPFGHQIGALAALLPLDHPWRADLAAYDALTEFATALRYPSPDGGLPPEPDRAALEEARASLSATLPRVAAWCAERSGR